MSGMLRLPWLLIALLLQGSPVLATELVLHGSNTIGEQLAVRLAEGWARSEGFANTELRIRAPGELELLGSAGARRFSVRIESHGSGTAFSGLLSGQADIGMSSRPATPDELTRARAKLGELELPQSEIVLAVDALAIIVHPDNPLKALTVGQLRDVFAGRVTNWRQLGGVAAPISLHARDAQSGTWDSFRSMVLGSASLTPEAHRYESTAELAAAVREDSHAIGFVGLSGVDGVRALAIADGGEPVLPQRFQVAVEDYPLARRLYLYVPGKSVPAAQDFVEFALSDAGQMLVEESGFVSQRVRAFEPVLRPDLPAEYAAIVDGAQRLSFNVRFSSGADLLDSKALRDLERLAGFMTEPEQTGRRLLLLGFADASESLPLMAISLSNDRVDHVAAMLARRGVATSRVRGFGGVAPVASNDSERGRNLNRRVEVWLH